MELATSEVGLERHKTVVNGLPRGVRLVACVRTEAISGRVEAHHSRGNSGHF